MKRIIAIVCLTMATITNVMVQQSDIPVILTAGQSNADGRVPVAELPDYVHYDYCQWSYGSGDYLTATGDFMPFSPTVARKDLGDQWGFDAIVYYLLEQQWERPFYVIKQTMGGTAIDTTCIHSTNGWFWSVDAKEKSLLNAFCKQIDDCLKQLPANYDIKCLLWHQGESDMTAAERYHDNLQAVIAHIRQHLVKVTGRKKYASLPVICGTFAKGSRQGSPKVAEALYQLEREDRHFHVVDASNLSLQSDKLHFDARGAEELGQRVFDKMKGLTNNRNNMKSFKSTAWLLPPLGRRTLAHLQEPVLIIGTYDENGKPNAMNAAWGGQWDMNEIIISLGSHQTTDNLAVNPELTVAFATAETMVASDYVGIVSGRNTPDKMEKTGWSIEKAPNVNAPVFKEFPMTLECRVKQKIDESETGYYLVAEIVNILCDEKFLAEDGKPDVEKMELITFDPVHHTYIQLGKTIGHAFSDGKQLK